MSAGGPSDAYSFGRARVVGGLACIGGAILLVFINALRDAPTDSVIFGLSLGTGTVLLGVEGLRKRLDGG